MDKKKIVLVSLGHLSCDINGGALPAVLPFLRSIYGYSYQDTAGLMFAFSCLSSLIQPLFGWLSDKVSKPWFIPLGVLLAGSGLAAVGFVHNYYAIFGVIVLSGVGAALFHPEGARFANRVSGTSKGAGLSIFSIGGNGGFVLGPMLAVTSIGMFGMPGTAAFGLLALCTASVLLWLVARMLPRQARKPGNSADAADSASPEPQVAQAAQEAQEEDEPQGRNNWKAFSRLTGAIICRSTLFVSFNIFIPLYWIDHFGQSAQNGALALTFFCICGVCCNLAGGFLSDRVGYLKIIRVGFLAGIPTIVLLGLADNLYLALALMPFLGFSLYAPFSSLVVLGQKYLAKNIGFASGVTLGLATTMGGVMAPVLGWVADTWGLQIAIQCLGGVAVVGAICAFLLTPPEDEALAAQAGTKTFPETAPAKTA